MYLYGSQNKQQFFFLTAVTCWSFDRDTGYFRCSRNSVFKYWSDEIYAL